MYLQLAENGYTPPSVYMAERTRVAGYRRRGGRVRPHYRSLSEDGDNPYVYLPAHVTGVGAALMVREDYFDDLTDNEWRQLMWELAPFQPAVQQQQMSEDMFLSAKADRKARREARKARREEKKLVKVDKKKAKNEIRQARAKARAEGGGGSILDNISGALGNIFGKGGGGGDVDPGAEPETDEAGFKLPNLFGIKPVIWVPGALIGGYLLATGVRRARKRRR